MANTAAKQFVLDCTTTTESLALLHGRGGGRLGGGPLLPNLARPFDLLLGLDHLAPGLLDLLDGAAGEYLGVNHQGQGQLAVAQDLHMMENVREDVITPSALEETTSAFIIREGPAQGYSENSGGTVISNLGEFLSDQEYMAHNIIQGAGSSVWPRSAALNLTALKGWHGISHPPHTHIRTQTHSFEASIVAVSARASTRQGYATLPNPKLSHVYSQAFFAS